APLLKETDMDEILKLQGLKYDAKRLAEIAAEVEVLNDAVRKAAEARLTFDDEPAAFASVMEREARK
ncbi:MAG TPA: hypothetical protein VFE73_07680, partial [Reyranella sp.]|nr:hypothetical protein [Reyranella sp.]